MTPRVLAYPPRHDYVDRLHGTVATLVHRDQPWPRLPDLYDPGWIGAHADEWDLAHLHFTWEQYPVDVLAAVLDTHQRAGRPVVWTAHDLRNPHTEEATADGPHLRLLADRSEAVVTLTPGAATEVEQRFGRRATVIPHGPLVPAEEAIAWRQRRSGDPVSTLLLHAKSLRNNLDVTTPIAVAERLAHADVPLRLLVAGHDEPAVRRVLEPEADRRGVAVSFHPRWSADELRDAMVTADALLLPYRWGTHSGMVELAADLGVPVLASDVGYLAEQVPLVTFAVREERIDPASLAAALRRAAGNGPPPPVPWQERERARNAFLEGHRQLYRELVRT